MVAQVGARDGIPQRTAEEIASEGRSCQVRLANNHLMWCLVLPMLCPGHRAESQCESQSQELARRQAELDDLKHQMQELTEKYNACSKPEEVQR